jgi:hypothetical protein
MYTFVIQQQGNSMFNFNNLSPEKKENVYQLLTNCANNFGGQNFFLQLLEEIRDTKTHPLCSRHQDFLSEFGTIRWGKTIFNDKIQLIEKVRQSRKESANILPKQKEKGYKKVLNMVKTLSPMTFSVRPSLRDSGEGFDFSAFNQIDKDTITLNPIFEALFFANIETVKKILNYKV